MYFPHFSLYQRHSCLGSGALPVVKLLRFTSNKKLKCPPSTLHLLNNLGIINLLPLTFRTCWKVYNANDKSGSEHFLGIHFFNNTRLENRNRRFFYQKLHFLSCSCITQHFCTGESQKIWIILKSLYFSKIHPKYNCHFIKVHYTQRELFEALFCFRFGEYGLQLMKFKKSSLSKYLHIFEKFCISRKKVKILGIQLTQSLEKLWLALHKEVQPQ